MASEPLPDLLHTLPELVRDSMLVATIDGDRTIHPQPFPRRNKPKQHTWVREKKLGQGGSGEVWLQRMLEGDDHSPKLRAVKVIRTPESENILQPNAGKWVRELEALAKFSQNKYKDFFVKSYGWYMTPGSLNISMEYYRDGDLKSYLEDVKTIPTDEVREIAQQVLGALDLMHMNGFAHRDLKPANILIKAKPPKSWWVKLCDFGLSKRPEALAENTTGKGTPSFMAPEMLGFPFTGDPKKANPYFVDMWCFGETLFRCHTGHASFEDTKQLWEYQQGNGRFPTDELQRVKARVRAIKFIRDLMKRNPSQRLDTTRARDHPWLRGEVESPVPEVAIERVPSPSRRRSSKGMERVGRETHGLLPINYDQISEASGRWSDTITRNDSPPRSYFSPLTPGTVRNPSPMATTSPHPEVPFRLSRSSVFAQPELRRVHEYKRRAQSPIKRKIEGTYLFDISPKDPSPPVEVGKRGGERVRVACPSDFVSDEGRSKGKKIGVGVSEKKSKTKASELRLEEIMKPGPEEIMKSLNHLSKVYTSGRHDEDQVPAESRNSKGKSKPTAIPIVPEVGMHRIDPLPCPTESDIPLTRHDDRDRQSPQENPPFEVSGDLYVSSLVPDSQNRPKSPSPVVWEPRRIYTSDSSDSRSASPTRISASHWRWGRLFLRGRPPKRSWNRSRSKENAYV